ncbi:MAG: archaeosortase/exosortase family protein, partial [Candidatus Bathyarchaeota archaeon]|nr:archaeosortase/exosortase family protein [Candidatus Bathyarchaeota archaeon]
LVYWYGSYTFTPLEFHMATLPVLAAGLTLIFFNAQTLKHLAFPIAFLFFLVPPPSEFLYHAGSTLAGISAEAANALVNVFGITSAISFDYGSPIITLTRPDQTAMQFSVDVACSGVYSLIGFTIFAVFIAYITRGRLRNKLAILILGIPLIVALNIIRLTVILAIGYHYGDQLALQVFHAVGATVLMFIGTFILLAVTEKAFKKPNPPEPCQNCNPHKLEATEEFCSHCGKLYAYPKIRLQKSDIAKIASVAILITVLLSIQAPVFALTEGPAQVLIQTPTGTQVNTQKLPLPQIAGYNLSFIYRDTNFEEKASQDASLAYAYKASDNSKHTVWVAVEIAGSTGKLHRWETCLINYPLSRGLQPRVTQLDLSDIHIQENPPLIARYFAFRYNRTNQTQVVLYWYETADFNVNGTSQHKRVKISLIAYPEPDGNISNCRSEMLPVAAAINNYWQPIKTWTSIALLISQNGLALSAAAIVILISLLFFRLFFRLREKSALLTLYGKMPEGMQRIVDAVAQTQRRGANTLRGIADELQLQMKTVKLESWLVQRLNETEKIGLIEKAIASKNDEPAVTWKSKVRIKGNWHRGLL